MFGPQLITDPHNLRAPASLLPAASHQAEQLQARGVAPPPAPPPAPALTQSHQPLPAQLPQQPAAAACAPWGAHTPPAPPAPGWSCASTGQPCPASSPACCREPSLHVSARHSRRSAGPHRSPKPAPHLLLPAAQTRQSRSTATPSPSRQAPTSHAQKT
ncbi:hypothetical protein COO60DRAFT_1515377 [Scenedesmus sp. NREL 46B-D3]|nr:hypothetical protein COO60DRAFT_1515377 [Scenedesmus sp. NREL 46B-D3]